MSDIPDAHEHLERAESFAHAGDNPIVPLTIAGMAVVAAILGSLESAAAARAIVARSSAAILQGEATDTWSFYQATSIKKNLYELFAETPGTPDPEALRTKAKKYDSDQGGIEQRARGQENAVKTQEDLSDQAMEQHHHLILATNAVHLAIALASVSMLMSRRWLFRGSLAALVAGIAIGVWAMVV
jgi:hypothetical protein